MFDVSKSDCGECAAGMVRLQLNGVIIQHFIQGIVNYPTFLLVFHFKKGRHILIADFG